MTLNLYPVNHGKSKNTWCGPSAISILTGAPTGEIAKVMRLLTGRRKIQGTFTEDMQKTLGAYGISMTEEGFYRSRKGRPTINQWWNQVGKNSSNTYLVSAGWHWQIVKGDVYACGQTASPVHFSDKIVPKRSRVEGWWVLNMQREIGLDREVKKVIEREEKAKRLNRPSPGWRITAAQIGITIERDYINEDITHWWVTPADNHPLTFEADPFWGCHIVHSAKEAEERVQEYAEYMRERGIVYRKAD